MGVDSLLYVCNMKQIKNQRDLKSHLKTPQAFTEEFNYKGFQVWWSEVGAVGVQSTRAGYFRCDPCTDKQYSVFNKLVECGFANYEWVLS